MPSLTTTYDRIIRQPALTMPGNATGSEAACTALTGSQIRALCGLGTTDNVTFNTVTATTSVLTPLVNNASAALTLGNSSHGVTVPGVLTVGGATTADAVINRDTGSGSVTWGLGIKYQSSLKAGIDANVGTGEVRLGGLASSYFPVIYSNGTACLSFTTGGAATFSGNVGIGTASPGAALQVNSDTPFRLVTAAGNVIFDVVTAGTGGATFNFYRPSSPYPTGNLGGSIVTGTSTLTMSSPAGCSIGVGSIQGYTSDYPAQGAISVVGQLHGFYFSDLVLVGGCTYGDGQTAGHLRLMGGGAMASETGVTAGHVYVHGGRGATNGNTILAHTGSATRGRVLVGTATDDGSTLLQLAGGITTSGQLTNATGTISASTPATFTQTWNNGAVTFTGLSANFTDTASASGSMLLSIQKSGSDRITTTKHGLTTLTFDTGQIYTGLTVKGTNGTTYWNLGNLIESGDSYVQLRAGDAFAGANHGAINLGAGYIHIIGGPTNRTIKTYNGLKLEIAALGGSGILEVTGPIQETYRTSSLDPTVSDIGSGKRQGWYNTTATEFRDWVNVGGTLYKSAAYT